MRIHETAHVVQAQAPGGAVARGDTAAVEPNTEAATAAATRGQQRPVGLATCPTVPTGCRAVPSAERHARSRSVEAGLALSAERRTVTRMHRNAASLFAELSIGRKRIMLRNERRVNVTNNIVSVAEARKRCLQALC
jgi:hypothetical protein